MKIGDLVKLQNKCDGWFGLTSGKLYRVYSCRLQDSILIKNDFDSKIYYPAFIFKSITRQQKLERILCQENLK